MVGASGTGGPALAGQPRLAGDQHPVPVPGTGDDRADPDHPDAAFADGFEPRGQPVITKHGRDIFDVAQTDETLRGLGVEHVVLTGLVTSHGIRLAALSALDRGYAVTVVSNACADTTREAHLAALGELRDAGVAVRSADELTASAWWQAGTISVGIAEVADITGLSRDTLRWYEREGLIPVIDRTSNGYRRYGSGDLARLNFIRHAREVGFSLPQTAELLALNDDSGRSSRAVKALTAAHIAELDAQIRRLNAMRATLQRWHDACRGDECPQCSILDGLLG